MSLEPNSLSALNYLKVSLLQAYVAIKKFDIVFLLETYFDSYSLSVDNTFKRLYKAVRADRPLLNKWCLYLFQKLSSFQVPRYSVLGRMY